MCVYRGVRRQFDVFTIYLRSCVEKYKFQRRSSTFHFCSYSFYRQPFTEYTPARYRLWGKIWSSRFRWPCRLWTWNFHTNEVSRERKPTRCNNQTFIINFSLNMFRTSLCPSPGEQRPCYCIWCTALLLLWRLLFDCRTVTFTVLASYNATPHNRYQPHPAEPEQYTIYSNTVFVLLEMGIMMPETCWDRS